MTRRERIVFLLEHYRDVEDGLQDGGITFDGTGYTPRMCRAFSHPSYVELRRCLQGLQDSEPVMWWNLAETYFRYDVRRIALCPRCQKEAPPGSEGDLHRHGGKAITLVPAMVKRISKAVREEVVDDAVQWIDVRFVGDPFIPDDLLPLAA